MKLTDAQVDQLEALETDNPAAYLVALAAGVMRECNTCGEDLIPRDRNRYDGGYQIACDTCLTRDPAHYLGEGMDPSPAMRDHLRRADD
jgi:hypothetical protein